MTAAEVTRRSLPLLVFAALALTACGAPSSTVRSAPSSSAVTTTTSASTTTTATTTAPPTVEVAEVVDGRTVTVAGGRRVVLAGLAEPGACWSSAATDFLRAAVTGKQVRVVGDAVLLPDGVDLAVLALEQGMARAGQAAAASFTAAQAVAQAAGRGLWGAPCAGADTVAPPPPPPHTPPPPPKETYTPPAQPVAPPPPPSAYYANCAAARAAGAAPLRIGEPGYRPALDRDGDGVACET
ncbi:excalibur calcium-binding domain-containing protein [Saccharothrix australiensis]|uniref:Excalibur calcium-binding domain-containing protein n=1 Tax=Saccharothrix australiensis TaxID=2072 RepID=A0A495VUK6_9PSEU|nr:excalibur calcium-binding domain-containing protein [Saccharothrix australiensis]RKT52153.1 excalibur calcium-binding domain-containing protein [Saccharothrix australiensis]